MGVSQDHLEEDRLITASGDQFRVMSTLGRGGMGVVYLAQQESLQRTVALKMVRAHGRDMAGLTQRLRQEAKGMGKIDHPNIVKIYSMAVSDDDGSPFLVMEYVDGKTLQEFLQEGPITEKQFYPLFDQVLQALTAAHASGLIHRDIKPSNILITKLGIAKLMDFGIAKHSVGSESSGDLQKETQPGILLGSPLYMSPEQCRGEKLDQRSDLYSLGCVMFEALCGSPPFHPESPMELLQMHLDAEPPDLPTAIHEPLKEVVYKALAKNPGDRFPDAEAMLEHLRASRTKTTGAVTKRHKLTRRTAPKLKIPTAVLSSMLLASLLVIAGGIYLVTHKPEQKPLPSGSISALPDTDSPVAAIKVGDELWQQGDDLATFEPTKAARKYAEALEAAEKACVIARRIHDREQLLEALRDVSDKCFYIANNPPNLNCTGITEKDLRAKSMEYAQQALDFVRQNYGANGTEYAAQLVRYADTQWNLGFFDKSIATTTESMHMWKRLNTDAPSPEMARCYERLADHYTQLEQFDKAKNILEDGLHFAIASGEGKGAQVQRFRDQYARILLAMNRPTEALNEFQKAAAGFLHLAQTAFNADSHFLHAANDYSAAGDVLIHLRRDEDALKAYQSAQRWLDFYSQKTDDKREADHALAAQKVAGARRLVARHRKPL